MTSPRLPLVNAQRSFLSGIRSSRECHGTQSESNSESYRVSKYKEPREIIRKKLRPREFRTSVFYRWRCLLSLWVHGVLYSGEFLTKTTTAPSQEVVEGGHDIFLKE